MASVIIANSNKDSARRIGAVLKSSGLLLSGICTTGAQVMEMTNYHYRGGVVVCSLDLPDLPAADLPGMARNYDFLFIAKPFQAGMVPALESACLMTPLRKPELSASVYMFLNLSDPVSPAVKKKIASGALDAKEIVGRAKALLMERNYFTEPQAHRFLQKKSMDTGKKLAETAMVVLELF
ncbi:ANTAR domain protein [Ruminococcaceae bacterium BL-6]|nr:ANTAR domain protein [Ruminococcaceae bacterium BL-6]